MNNGTVQGLFVRWMGRLFCSRVQSQPFAPILNDMLCWRVIDAPHAYLTRIYHAEVGLYLQLNN